MRSNSDLWIMIGGSIALLLMMCWLVYDKEATANLGLVIPIISYAAGFILCQSIEEMTMRSLKVNK